METVKEIVQRLKTSLSTIYSERESEQIIRLLFKEYLGWDGAAIILNYDHKPDHDVAARLRKAGDRLLQGEPVQYITGTTEFFGLALQVGRGVLIPRQETEELVSHVLQSISRTGSSGLRFLDIGTGSGCIAIAVKKNAPSVVVEALDNSKKALTIARENARRHHVDITFHHGDILNRNIDRLTGHFDIIVSNPPYIPMREKPLMHRNILDFEPGSALFVPDADPLIFYGSIARFASCHLTRPGYLIAEIHESFGIEIREMFRNAGFDQSVILKDMNGKDRFISVIHQ